jgi:ectoine hydroxylase-related dioxygenase (phytanoyl-CoA dioxygenase family)
MSGTDAAQRTSLAGKITDADVAAYQRDGAVVLRGVLSGDDLALLEIGIEEAYNAGGGRSSRVQGKDGRGGTVVDQLPSLASPSLRAFLDRGIAPELAARMMGVPAAHFVLDQLFYKESGRVLPTPWHQDTPFLNVRGDDMARVWITCDPSPRELTVELVRGSHRWNVVYDTATAAASELQTVTEGGDFSYSGIGDSSLPTMPDIARYRDSFDILRWDVAPGDALIFNGNMLHGASGLDDHPMPRRAYASMWGGPKLRHHCPPGKTMPSIAELNGIAVPHGAPIGDYPEAFPVGWASTR